MCRFQKFNGELLTYLGKCCRLSMETRYVSELKCLNASCVLIIHAWQFLAGKQSALYDASQLLLLQHHVG